MFWLKEYQLLRIPYDSNIKAYITKYKWVDYYIWFVSFPPTNTTRYVELNNPPKEQWDFIEYDLLSLEEQSLIDNYHKELYLEIYKYDKCWWVS